MPKQKKTYFNKLYSSKKIQNLDKIVEVIQYKFQKKIVDVVLIFQHLICLLKNPI